MSLSRLEQETIILFNESEAEASVYTHNGRLTRRLEQLHKDRPDEVRKDHVGDFIIPKGWIKINPKRIMSEEEKAEIRNRFKTSNEPSCALCTGEFERQNMKVVSKEG